MCVLIWGNITVNQSAGLNYWMLLVFTKLCLFMNDSKGKKSHAHLEALACWCWFLCGRFSSPDDESSKLLSKLLSKVFSVIRRKFFWLFSYRYCRFSSSLLKCISSSLLWTSCCCKVSLSSNNSLENKILWSIHSKYLWLFPFVIGNTVTTHYSGILLEKRLLFESQSSMDSSLGSTLVWRVGGPRFKYML